MIGNVPCEIDLKSWPILKQVDSKYSQKICLRFPNIADILHRRARPEETLTLACGYYASYRTTNSPSHLYRATRGQGTRPDQARWLDSQCLELDSLVSRLNPQTEIRGQFDPKGLARVVCPLTLPITMFRFRYSKGHLSSSILCMAE